MSAGPPAAEPPLTLPFLWLPTCGDGEADSPPSSTGPLHLRPRSIATSGLLGRLSFLVAGCDAPAPALLLPLRPTLHPLLPPPTSTSLCECDGRGELSSDIDADRNDWVECGCGRSGAGLLIFARDESSAACGAAARLLERIDALLLPSPGDDEPRAEPLRRWDEIQQPCRAQVAMLVPCTTEQQLTAHLRAMRPPRGKRRRWDGHAWAEIGSCASAVREGEKGRRVLEGIGRWSSAAHGCGSRPRVPESATRSTECRRMKPFVGGKEKQSSSAPE